MGTVLESRLRPRESPAFCNYYKTTDFVIWGKKKISQQPQMQWHMLAIPVPRRLRQECYNLEVSPDVVPYLTRII